MKIETEKRMPIRCSGSQARSGDEVQDKNNSICYGMEWDYNKLLQ